MDNIGSIKSIEIADISYFSGFGPVEFKSGCNWEKINFNPERAVLNQSVEDSDNGLIFKFSGQFYKSKIDSSQNTIKKYLGKRSVMKIIDQNDEVYIIGHPSYPVNISMNGSTGTKYIDENGINYSFAAEQIFPHYSA